MLNKKVRIVDLKEHEVYKIHQGNGYSDGVNLTRLGNTILLGHFWENGCAYRESEITGDTNIFSLINIRHLNEMTSSISKDNAIDQFTLLNYSELSLEQFYNEIYLPIYNEYYTYKRIDERYFSEIETSKTYEEWVSSFV